MVEINPAFCRISLDSSNFRGFFSIKGGISSSLEADNYITLLVKIFKSTLNSQHKTPVHFALKLFVEDGIVRIVFRLLGHKQF